MIENSVLLRNKTFGIVCLLGAILNFVAYYPGFLSPDGLDQYGQALTGIYQDWHPPLMAAWWHVLIFFYKGPQLMLLFQVLCLWASGFLLGVSFDVKWWKWVVLSLLLTPFVQNFVGYIVKDSQMAMSWLLAFSIMFFCTVRRIRGISPAIISALLLFYGGAVRVNAIPGCIPLSVFYIAVFVPGITGRARYLYGIFLSLFFWGLQMLVTQIAIHPMPSNSANKLFLHDMVAVYAKTGDPNVFPPILYKYRGFDTAYLRRNYHPATLDMVWWNNDGVTVSEVSNTLTSGPIRRYWWKAVSHHPLAYIKHRVSGFLYYLRLRDRGAPLCNFYFWETENSYGIKFKSNAIFRVISQPVELSGSLPFMQPWFWFFLNIVCMFFIRTIKNHPLRMAYTVLLWSGLLYQLPSIAIYQTDTDFRYFYWNCITVYLAGCLLLANKFIPQE